MVVNDCFKKKCHVISNFCNLQFWNGNELGKVDTELETNKINEDLLEIENMWYAFVERKCELECDEISQTD